MNKSFYISGCCHIKEDSILLDGNTVFEKDSPDLTSFLKAAYKNFETDYPKFFKMDRLSKLAFMAAEVLLRHPSTSSENSNSLVEHRNTSQEYGNTSAEIRNASQEDLVAPENNRYASAGNRNASEEKRKMGANNQGTSQENSNLSPENRNLAIVLSNRAASLDTDRKHQQSISDKDNFYPSPAVFVYTLPNICIGEISIRHKLRSENSFFIFDAFDPEFLQGYTDSLLHTEKADEVLCGWVDVDQDRYEAFMYIVSPDGILPHTERQITKLYLTP